MMNNRWKNRPQGSTWGDFGPDDQVGRINLLTPERRLEAVKEVKAGISFCLSLPLDYPGGNSVNSKRFPPVLRPTFHSDDSPYYNLSWRDYHPGFEDVSSDDSVLLHTQYSTQWDSLGHAGALFDADGDGVEEIVYYNGWRGKEHIKGPSDTGASGRNESVKAERLGIENMAATCVQGRGVLLDLHARYGDERVSVGFEELECLMREDGVVVEPGDMLVLNTGWATMLYRMNLKPNAEKLHSSCAVLDGDDPKLLDWLESSQISALIADNFAIEDARIKRAKDYKGPRLPIHNKCLFRLGVPLGELWYLEELTAWLKEKQRNRFLLTAPPLRLSGAVGSPVTPVATV
jgi:kynurenine formamidase